MVWNRTEMNTIREEKKGQRHLRKEGKLNMNWAKTFLHVDFSQKV